MLHNLFVNDSDRNQVKRIWYIWLNLAQIYLRLFCRKSNPKLAEQIQSLEDYTIHGNLLIGYSTLSAHSAYEVLQIECSQTVDINDTYELRSKDIVLEGASQYAGSLCAHLGDDVDVSSLLDKVHEGKQDIFFRCVNFVMAVPFVVPHWSSAVTCEPWAIETGPGVWASIPAGR